MACSRLTSPCPSGFPVLPGLLVGRVLAVAIEGGVRRDEAGVERRGGDERLEGGAGRVQAVDDPVEERVVGLGRVQFGVLGRATCLPPTGTDRSPGTRPAPGSLRCAGPWPPRPLRRPSERSLRARAGCPRRGRSRPPPAARCRWSAPGCSPAWGADSRGTAWAGRPRRPPPSSSRPCPAGRSRISARRRPCRWSRRPGAWRTPR